MIVVASMLLGLAITELVLVKTFITEIENDVNTLVIEFESNKEDITKLTTKIEVIHEKWDTQEQLLCLMFNHKDLSMLTDCITRVSEYCKQNNYNDGIVELKILQEYTKKNHHIMGFNFNNIL
jgi:predicted  nucleic acid-binding Zn-ribbon protein